MRLDTSVGPWGKEAMKAESTALAATLLILSPWIRAEGNRTCRTGKLVNVQESKTLVPTGTTQHVEEKDKKKGKKEYNSYSTSGVDERTTYTVSVALDDMTYTGQSNYLGFGFRPTSFVVNDPVQACVDGKKLILIRPDGKEYRSNIVQAVRNTEASPPTAADSSSPASGSSAASSPAKLQVASNPAGADIELDGAFVGSTPSKIEIAPGDHDLAVVKDGYKRWTRKIRVTGGEININADLQR
jgi:hypothetical protein